MRKSLFVGLSKMGIVVGDVNWQQVIKFLAVLVISLNFL
jgi:hypothetical protein